MEYAAPEMLQESSSKGYDASIDVFSLGVVFLQIFGEGSQWRFARSPGAIDYEELRSRLQHPDSQLPLLLPLEIMLSFTLFIRQMLEMELDNRIPVVEIHRYLPYDIYAEVLAGEQTCKLDRVFQPLSVNTDPRLVSVDDWTPGPWNVPRLPIERYSEFLSFQEDPAHHDVTEEWRQAARRIRMDEENAKPTDLEYRAPGAFED
ncbi:hypothetical protein TRAPUB_7509 [Trametes pubescens]|uniref:Protein kinase domain-containing protein n=1 Tax=Trametes pubescens TaxID=154538 RepID=A0A1M2V312_TRAPU|nr:hypothetical protein TRAPUB_7509 [Trametes pubescens]